MRELPTREELLNLWLVPFHNITAEEVAKKYPEKAKSADWFKMFPCTEEQSKEWEKSAKEMMRKKYKLRKWYVDKGWPWVFLDCSPYTGVLNNEKGE